MKKPVWGFLFLCLAAVVFWFSQDYLNLDYLKVNFEKIQAMHSEKPVVFTVTFSLLYVTAISLSIPGSIFFSLAAGAFFGWPRGVLLASFAGSIGATLAFLSSRYLFRDWVHRRYSKAFEKIDLKLQEEGPYYLVSLRLIATVPFFLVNILMGVTSMPIKTFYFFSQIGMLPLTIVYVNAGVQLSKMQKLEDLLSVSLLVAFALLGLLPWFLKWFLQKVRPA